MARAEALAGPLRELLGERGLCADPDELAPLLVEPRGLYRGSTPFVARPATTEQAAAVVRLCREAGVAVVPQGGNTGLCGGAMPAEDGSQLLVSLGRMNRIRELDALNYTMTVEAGCILRHVQTAAAEADRLFPLSLGAEGSCTVGGNISTNAGGINTLRYGNTRELVLGLEAVLPDGRVWNGLRRLRKDNTGYDLKQLFIGGEGTLGIVTAACVKLFPRPREEVTAFAALPSIRHVIELLSRLRAATGDQVSAFEYIGRFGIDLALKHVPGVRDPFDRAYMPTMRCCAPMPAARAPGCARSSRRRSAGPSRTAWCSMRRSPTAGRRRTPSGASARPWSRLRSRKAGRSSTMSRCR